MNRKWSPWWSFLTAGFVVACFLYLVSCTRAQQPPRYYVPHAPRIDTSPDKPVPAVRESREVGQCCPDCPCGPGCTCKDCQCCDGKKWLEQARKQHATWPPPAGINMTHGDTGTVLTVPSDMFPLTILVGPPTMKPTPPVVPPPVVNPNPPAPGPGTNPPVTPPAAGGAPPSGPSAGGMKPPVSWPPPAWVQRQLEGR